MFQNLYKRVPAEQKTTYYGNYAPVVSWELPADRLPANLDDNFFLLFLFFFLTKFRQNYLGQPLVTRIFGTVCVPWNNLNELWPQLSERGC